MTRKLSDEAREQIQQARSAGATYPELAARYNVSTSTIHAVLDQERHLLTVIRTARRRLKRLREERERAETAAGPPAGNDWKIE